ncbi:hypothetical protein ABE354_19525 [Brevibacillus laterosporus]
MCRIFDQQESGRVTRGDPDLAAGATGAIGIDVDFLTYSGLNRGETYSF